MTLLHMEENIFKQHVCSLKILLAELLLQILKSSY